MSKTNQNSLTKYYSGKFGKDFVLRNKNGMSTLAKLPKPTSVPPSVKQTDVRAIFRLAVNFAKRSVADPVLSAYYLSNPGKGNSVYRLALMDYLKPPVIEKIKTDAYTGVIGGKITIIAVDDFQVVNVNVSIKAANGTLIEEGPCVADATDTVWNYTTTVVVPDTTGMIITAEAFDKPGGSGKNSITL